MNETWLPPYKIRKSSRAKRVQIRLCPQRGLELVIPPKFPPSQALAFLKSNLDWIERHSALIPLTEQKKTLPDEITLTAINRKWQIRYDNCSERQRIKLSELLNELVLTGPIANHDKCISTLQNWLRNYAKKYLSLRIQEISDHCQLPFNQLTIRKQKTRWGSCSSEKNISLNYKLLFLPAEIVDYVIIHELCHTIHLNHSRKFWQLVASYCPDYRRSKLKLHAANEYIPNWV